MQAGESESMQNQVVICKGWFLSYNTYDCGSFVMNGKAVMRKERYRYYKQKNTLSARETEISSSNGSNCWKPL